MNALLWFVVVLRFTWIFTVLIGTAYFVFVAGHSGWWWLLAVLLMAGGSEAKIETKQR